MQHQNHISHFQALLHILQRNPQGGDEVWVGPVAEFMFFGVPPEVEREAGNSDAVSGVDEPGAGLACPSEGSSAPGDPGAKKDPEGDPNEDNGGGGECCGGEHGGVDRMVQRKRVMESSIDRVKLSSTQRSLKSSTVYRA